MCTTAHFPVEPVRPLADPVRQRLPDDKGVSLARNRSTKCLQRKTPTCMYLRAYLRPNSLSISIRTPPTSINIRAHDRSIGLARTQHPHAHTSYKRSQSNTMTATQLHNYTATILITRPRPTGSETRGRIDIDIGIEIRHRDRKRDALPTTAILISTS